MYGTYAAKAFLRSNVAPLTYVRLRQQSAQATGDGECGTNQRKSRRCYSRRGGGAYGLFVAHSASITRTEDGSDPDSATGSFHLAAVFYADQGTMLLSGAVMQTADLASKKMP